MVFSRREHVDLGAMEEDMYIALVLLMDVYRVRGGLNSFHSPGARGGLGPEL